MSGKSETTHEVDARTNQPVQPMQFDVASHDDYLRLREAFSRLPKIPTLLRPEEQPTATAANRYVFHDDERYQRAAREAEAAQQGGRT